ncbi:MAG: PD40 domain-containing protein [Anaerolineae bacterium]|nr:PD40 domain-containing protein [Anaerolineae bacterium]
MNRLSRLVITLLLLTLCLLDTKGTFAQAIFLYSYLYKTRGDKPPVLVLVDSSDLDKNQFIELPLLTEARFSLHGAFPDPSGEWLALPFINNQIGVKLTLHNIITKELLEIAQGSFGPRDVYGQSDQHIVWSPDGQFLAFSMRPSTATDDNQLGAYLYNMQDRSVIGLIENLTYLTRIAWSQDSQSLVLSTLKCEPGFFDASHCAYGLATFDAKSGTKQTEVALILPPSGPADIDALCALDWSPDNRFVSFVPFCRLEPMSPPIEVYVWDTVQGDYYPVTDFTGEIIQPADRIYLAAYYETAWIAADTLLVGAYWDDGIKLNTQTISVQLPERVSVEVAPEAIEELAVNPVTGEFAYRSVTAPPLDINKPLSVANPRLNIGVISGAGLSRNSSLEINACRLKWSPDGTILAFTLQEELGAFSYNCSGGVAASLGFMNATTGAVTEYVIPAPSDPDRIQQAGPVGWVRVQ